LPGSPAHDESETDAVGIILQSTRVGNNVAVLFVSHASQDDARASALEAWLTASGFTDLFVDHHSIAGGDKWREELRASAGACRVVLCLVTESWLASHECFNEFRAAWYMGKRIIPLFLLPVAPDLGEEPKKRLAEVCAEYQGIDLAPCIAADLSLDFAANEHVASRLKAGLHAAGALSQVGLDPRTFAIDRKLRPTPFPGLASFGDDDADAALFYGRSREIAHTLEELRTMRALRDMRPLVILGASGSGKSSLLKAGVIPRLRREGPAWLPLRAFRPGADPLLNFAEALARTYADFAKVEAYGLIRERMFDAWSRAERGENGDLTAAGLATLEHALEAEGRKLREAANRPGASILVSIDQAEEIARAEGRSGEALADYLRVALAATETSWQLAFTIRTDSFPELQSHRRFQDLEARGYDLRAIPVFRFDSVVEEPAKRYGVEIDSRLVDALMDAAPNEDALPLLAFALQRLWRQFAESGALTKDNYDRVGGLTLLIEDAAERALRGIEPEQDVPLPAGAPPKRLVDLGAVTFVPALAQINEQGATIRRVADWASFSEEQQELLSRLDRWRLVVRKGTEAGGGTVEVAHEALFREWARLKSWFEPERARLEALRALQVDASAWDRNGRDSGFLNHRGKRLAEADALAASEGYRQRLGQAELDYLAACREAERSAQRRMRRMWSLFGVLVLGVAIGVAGWLNESYLRERYRYFTIVRPYMLAQFRPHVLTADAERRLKPKDSFRECAKDCPEMVVLPAGEFIMGSPPDEKDRNADEGPQHKVVLGKPFAASKFEVTFDEWDVCVAYGDCDRVDDSGVGRGRIPVINVTWNDARRYVAWLSRMTGQRYRLLTEAEWEYAARAGSTTAYHFGSDEAALGQYAWYSANHRDPRRPHPIGEEKPPNAFGLHDVHGNVWEWVEDCYKSTYEEAPTDGSAWTAGNCSIRVTRGGSWDTDAHRLRSALRKFRPTVIRDDDQGFRVARTLTQ
jgi:formylglycine-generating enzyme required for sulfatase activity